MPRNKTDLQASQVIDRVIRGGIQWFDYKTMDLAARAGYWANSQAILNNNVFKNEYNAYISDLIKRIAYDSCSHEETMAIRTLITGMEAFRLRIESIENPNTSRNTKEDLNEAI